MDTQIILEKPGFYQYKISLRNTEHAALESSPFSKSIYVLTGVGVVSIEEKEHQLKCGESISIEPNTPFTISNPGLGLFNIILTQVFLTQVVAT